MKITISKSSNIAIRFAKCGVNAWIFSENVILACNEGIKWRLCEQIKAFFLLKIAITISSFSISIDPRAMK